MKRGFDDNQGVAIGLSWRVHFPRRSHVNGNTGSNKIWTRRIKWLLLLDIMYNCYLLLKWFYNGFCRPTTWSMKICFDFSNLWILLIYLFLFFIINLSNQNMKTIVYSHSYSTVLFKEFHRKIHYITYLRTLIWEITESIRFPTDSVTHIIYEFLPE